MPRLALFYDTMNNINTIVRPYYFLKTVENKSYSFLETVKNNKEMLTSEEIQGENDNRCL